MNAFSEVAAVNLTYFLVGLLLGLGISRALVWMERKAVNENESEKKRRFHPATIWWVRAAVIFVVSLVIFGVGVRVGYERLHDKVDCFDDYANRSADVTVKRAALNERDSDAKTKLLTEIAEINTQSEEATAALVEIIRQADTIEEIQQVLITAGTSETGDLTDVFDEFEAEMDAIQEARDENPVPDPPREVCGD